MQWKFQNILTTYFLTRNENTVESSVMNESEIIFGLTVFLVFKSAPDC